MQEQAQAQAQAQARRLRAVALAWVPDAGVVAGVGRRTRAHRRKQDGRWLASSGVGSRRETRRLTACRRSFKPVEARVSMASARRRRRGGSTSNEEAC